MATKVLVSFPDEFLAEGDRIAREESRTRSELLREAIRLYIENRRGKRRPLDDPRVQRAVAIQDAIARVSSDRTGDSTEEIRRWREMRR
ncbi:MAG: ribbon-helix-helix protein, CopG family [Anaerolineae bacterium]|nr:ribbon-helix-helix protein, CopG family [Anaerolineae bacterium]